METTASILYDDMYYKLRDSSPRKRHRRQLNSNIKLYYKSVTNDIYLAGFKTWHQNLKIHINQILQPVKCGETSHWNFCYELIEVERRIYAVIKPTLAQLIA